MNRASSRSSHYRGRIAPTPTGYLHLGHARTFWVCRHRAREAGGHLIYRDEDLDPERCREAYSRAALEDCRWLKLDWDEGPDISTPGGDFIQSHRHREGRYLAVWEQLKDGGWIYPCSRSRREIADAAGAGSGHPDTPDEEPVYPPEWRPAPGAGRDAASPGETNWRFRVPDGNAIRFRDGVHGDQSFVGGTDFGDFLVWRKNGFPAYELAVVVDDVAMGITEVVRGADLLKSTARQLLLYEALGAAAPAFFHCPLVRDESGARLAKRDASMSLRTLRAAGRRPEEFLEGFRKDYQSWIRS